MGSAGLFTYVYVCMHMHKYVYMYVCNNNNQWKEAIKLKMGKTWEMFNIGYLGGVGGRKGKRERDDILFQLKK